MTIKNNMKKKHPFLDVFFCINTHNIIDFFMY